MISIVLNVNAKRRLWVKFDSVFDMGETNRLYCSEMVRLAINEAVGTNLVGFTKVCGRNVVAIDDLYRNGFRRIYDSHHIAVYKRSCFYPVRPFKEKKT